MLISKTMVTETAHRLTGYPGKCAHLHGHSYSWKLTLSYDYNLLHHNLCSSGMVVDFGDVKTVMKDIIDLPFDHGAVFNEQDPLFKYLTLEEINSTFKPAYPSYYQEEIKKKNQSLPEKVGKLHLVPFNPTAENLALLVSSAVILKQINLSNINHPHYTGMPLPHTVVVEVGETEDNKATCIQNSTYPNIPVWWDHPSISYWKEWSS